MSRARGHEMSGLIEQIVRGYTLKLPGSLSQKWLWSAIFRMLFLAHVILSLIFFSLRNSKWTNSKRENFYNIRWTDFVIYTEQSQHILLWLYIGWWQHQSYRWLCEYAEIAETLLKLRSIAWYLFRFPEWDESIYLPMERRICIRVESGDRRQRRRIRPRSLPTRRIAVLGSRHRMTATNSSLSAYIDFRANKVYTRVAKVARKSASDGIFSVCRPNLFNFVRAQWISDQRLIFPLHLSRGE